MQAHPPKTRADLMARLADLAITVETLEHDAVFTVAESENLVRQMSVTMPGAHTKNLFLKDAKGRLFLVVAESHTAVDLKALPGLINSGRLSFGKPELLLQTLGVTPGSVTALSLINDPEQKVSIVVDARLMDYDHINCHPLENTATTRLARDDLMRFIRACGHEPHITRLSA